MTKRSKRFLTILLCAAIVSNFGCTTTTPRADPSQVAMDGYETGIGDNVLVGAEIEELRRAEPSQAAMDDYGTGKSHSVWVRTAIRDDSRIDRKRQTRRCRVARVMHASLMMYANPSFVVVYLADYLKRRNHPGRGEQERH